jgi:hypothetical protein
MESQAGNGKASCERRRMRQAMRVAHNSATAAETSQNTVAGMAIEHHYAPDELGELWNLSADTVRRLFEREPDVLVIERGTGRARRYRTLRIPESVAQRVHRRMSQASKKAS